MTKEVIDQALEALEEIRNALAWFYDSYPQDVTKKGNDLLPHVETVLTALREALAEQPAQQEPVAWIEHNDETSEPCPSCGKPLQSASGGGVVCSGRCGYWFCF